MAINIGDNFSYMGKKFLDSRQSFDTIVMMNDCSDVPIGFITFVKENNTRYEYTENGWVVYSSNISDEDVERINIAYIHAQSKHVEMKDLTDFVTKEYVENAIDNIDIPTVDGVGGINAVIQDDEPEDTSVIWFDTDDEYIPREDPYISELKSIISAMSSKLQALTSRVEYLENVIAGGVITPPTPDDPDDPGDTSDISYLLWDDGTPILWDDGSPILLEEQQEVSDTNRYLLWDDGTLILWDDGSPILLEEQQEVSDTNRYLLWDDGKPIIWDDGKPIILER